MPELRIEESQDSATEPKVLYLEGFIDSATVMDLQKKLEDVLARGQIRIILDCDKLSYLGSSGISVMLDFSSRAGEKAGSIILCNVPDKINKVITMVGLHNVMQICGTQKEALAYYQEKPAAKPALSKQKESLSFPVQRECPHCAKAAMVPRADILRCQFCKKLLYVSLNGDVMSLESNEGDIVQSGTWFKLDIPSNIIYLNSVRAFLTSILGESGRGTEADTSDIELAVDEAVANVMEHAYGMDKTKKVRVSFFLTDEYFLVKLIDNGKPFDLTAKIKEEEQNIDSQKKRGRGCYIIKQVMDKLEYQSIPDIGNELVMLRYFKRPQKDG